MPHKIQDVKMTSWTTVWPYILTYMREEAKKK